MSVDAAVPVAAGEEAAPHRLGPIAVLFTMVLWGVGSVFPKLVESSGLAFAFFRLWLAVPVLVGILIVRGGRLSLARVRASALGGVCFGVHICLFIASIHATTVANVNIIASLHPALVLVVAGPLFGEVVGRRDRVLTLVAVAGTAGVLLAAPTGGDASRHGDALAVASLLAFTAYFLASKRARRTLDALEYLAGAVLVAALVVTPFALLHPSDLGTVDGRDWIWVLAVVLLPGTVGHLSMIWAHGHVPVALSSCAVLGVPALAAGVAWLALGERVTPLQALLGVGVIATVAFVLLRPATARADADLVEPTPGVPAAP